VCIEKVNGLAEKGAQNSSERQYRNKSNHYVRNNCPGVEKKHIYIHLKAIFVNRLNKTTRLGEQMGKWNKQMEKLYF